MSGIKKVLQDSCSAMTASMNQLQRVGWWKAAADSPCPSCLDYMDYNAAYTDSWPYAFCFSCLLQWAAQRAADPLCFSRILHRVRVDENYLEYMVGSSPCSQRTVARHRVPSKSLQRCYHCAQGPSTRSLSLLIEGGLRGGIVGSGGTQLQRPVTPLPWQLQGAPSQPCPWTYFILQRPGAASSGYLLCGH